MSAAERRSRIQLALIFFPLLLLAWKFGGFLAGKDLETARAAIILSTLFVGSLITFWLVSRSDPEGLLLLLLLYVSFVLKLFAIVIMFKMRLLADAVNYNQKGAQIAHGLALGLLPLGTKPYGTDNVNLFTGIVYLFTGETFYGISILWAWLALVGMLFFYKAFSTAFPQGHRRLYMFLIFLYPTLVLWTSELGKDSLMILFLGMAAYGVARLQRQTEPFGVLCLALGSIGMLLVRPHIAAAFAAALGGWALIRPMRAGPLTPVLRFGVLIAVIGMMVGVLYIAATNIKGLEGLSTGDVASVIESEQQGSTRGGSAIETVSPLSLRGLASAVPTALFVPYPWQISGVSTAAAAAESFFLMLLILFRWQSVVRAIRAAARNAYLFLTLIDVALLIVFLSLIGNVGTLIRQRAQLLPFLFMLIAYQAARSKRAPFRLA